MSEDSELMASALQRIALELEEVNGSKVLERIANALNAIAARGQFVPPPFDFITSERLSVATLATAGFRVSPRQRAELRALHVYCETQNGGGLASVTVGCRWVASQVAIPPNGLQFHALDCELSADNGPSVEIVNTSAASVVYVVTAYWAEPVEGSFPR